MKELRLVKALMPLLQRYRWSIVALVVFGFFTALAEGISISLFMPLLYSLDQATFQPLADNVLGHWLDVAIGYFPASNRLLFVALGIYGLIIFKNILSYSNDLLFALMDNCLVQDLRCRTFEQLLYVDLRFIERHESGKLLHALEHETWDTSAALGKLVEFAIVLCSIIVFVTLLLLISRRLTLAVLLAMWVISTIIQVMTRRVENLSHMGLRSWEAFTQRTIEAFRGMRTIRAFGREAYERQQFVQASKDTSYVYLKLELLTAMVPPVSEILIATILIGIIVTTLQAPGNLPTVLTFLFILYRLQPYIQQLDEMRIGLIAALAPVETVMQLLDRCDKPYVLSGSIPFRGMRDGITFQSVVFRYDPADSPALRDVSMHIPKGSTLALVGPSGAGKSTSINLLLRFYDPQQGTIYIDDTPLPQLDLATWRHRIAVVSQDVHLFNATVRQNIAYGRLDATEADIIAAAQQAVAHDFICALPQGYETKLGDQGVRLSAGQKQRLALARAFVRNPEILILDEVTSALDSITEHLVQQTLDAMDPHCTVIIIAHRFSTIERADHIVVLEEGRVCEQGDLKQLLQRGGLFAQLYTSHYHQTMSEIAEEGP